MGGACKTSCARSPHGPAIGQKVRRMHICKLFAATAAAAVLLAALVGSSPAGRLSISNPRWRATYANLHINFPGGTYSCLLTLEGSFHSRTMSKTTGALVGHVITAQAVDTGCVGIRWTVLRETLPWHVRYAAFTGTLPSISSLAYSVTGFAFVIQESFLRCLFRSTEESPVYLTFRREAGGALTSVALNGTVPSGEISGCGGSAGLEGTSSTLTNESGSRITVTLI
jgi:hypothetical protein